MAELNPSSVTMCVIVGAGEGAAADGAAAGLAGPAHDASGSGRGQGTGSEELPCVMVWVHQVQGGEALRTQLQRWALMPALLRHDEVLCQPH